MRDKRSYLLTFLFWLAIDSSLAAEPVQIVTEESYPLSYVQTINGEDQITGIATQLIRELMIEAGVEYKLILLPWARALRKSQTHRNVLIYSIARTRAREQEFKWVGEIVKLDYWLYGLNTNSSIGKNLSPQALRSLKVGVVRDDIFHGYLESLGFKNLVILNSGAQHLPLLDRGRVDLFPSNAVGLQPFCTNLDFDCDRLIPVKRLPEISTSLYLAFNLATDDETFRRVVTAYKTIRESGRFAEVMGQLNQQVR